MGMGRPIGAATAKTLNRETILVIEQLDDFYGILGATVLAVYNNPVLGDLITVTDGTTTRTYGAWSGGDIQYSPVTYGYPARADIPETLTNLANAINNDTESAWTAVATGWNLIIIEEDNYNDTSKIYGTWATQENCEVVNYASTNDYFDGHFDTLPSLESQAFSFGKNRTFEDLINGEIHHAIYSKTMSVWDASNWVWSPIAAAGGVTSVDTTLGLIFSNGELSGPNMNNTGQFTHGLPGGIISLHYNTSPTATLGNDANGIKVLGVPSLFNIGTDAVGSTVTAPNLDKLTNGSDADADSLHTHNGPEWIKATTADITLYVRSDGNDDNDGLTTGTAMLTIQEAVDRVPKFIKHNVTIDIGEGSFGPVNISGFHVSGLTGNFIFQGTLGTPTVATGTTSGTATGGTKTTLIDTGQGWTPNDLIGKMVFVDPQYRVIYKNTSDTLYFENPLSAIPGGKAYSLTEPKTVLTGTEPLNGYGPFALRSVDGGRHAYIQNLAIASGTIAYFISDCSGIDMYRCTCSNASYSYYIQNVWGDMQFDELYATTASVAGFVVQVVANRLTLNGAVANACKDGYEITWSNEITLNGPVAINNTQDGIFAVGLSKLDFDNRFVAQSNTRHGLYFDGAVSWCDLDACSITNNGGYGIKIDETISGNFGAGSFLNGVGTLVLSGNTLGGIAGFNNSIIALTACTGTNAGAYGLTLETGSYATITSDTAITGATGDATINGGVTNLSWATDFASDGDIVVNTDNGCRIERKD